MTVISPQIGTTRPLRGGQTCYLTGIDRGKLKKLAEREGKLNNEDWFRYRQLVDYFNRGIKLHMASVKAGILKVFLMA